MTWIIIRITDVNLSLVKCADLISILVWLNLLFLAPAHEEPHEKGAYSEEHNNAHASNQNGGPSPEIAAFLVDRITIDNILSAGRSNIWINIRTEEAARISLHRIILRIILSY